MFPLMETIKIVNGNPCNLRFHQKRIAWSGEKLFGEKIVFPLYEILQEKTFPEGICKLNFYYNAENFSLKITPYFPRKIRTLKLIYDEEISYDLKYTNRDALNRLFQKRFPADEILIVKQGKITDTSFSNIIFFDGKHWQTPDTPLLEGTQRAKLLEQKKVFPRKITPDHLNEFSHFALINAMLEVGKGLNINRIFE